MPRWSGDLGWIDRDYRLTDMNTHTFSTDTIKMPRMRYQPYANVGNFQIQPSKPASLLVMQGKPQHKNDL
jgi:uncharacterized lipoprotein